MWMDNRANDRVYDEIGGFFFDFVEAKHAYEEAPLLAVEISQFRSLRGAWTSI